MITESLLHFLWKKRIFLPRDFSTTQGKSIRIIHPGFSHHNAGPDFKQAVIKIDNITWAGDVEIHINSSDWYKHGHQYDEKYKTVVLHVVYNHDMEIARSENEFIQTFEIKNVVNQEIIEKYNKLMNESDNLACLPNLQNISSTLFASTLIRLATERLTNRKELIFNIVKENNNNWNEALFRLLLISFGFKTNAPAFEMLGKSLPYKYLEKHSASRLQVYAIIFGQAGLLNTEYEDVYYKSLQMEYQYLKRKYKLMPIRENHWNYLRLRPQNFPCLRLAQVCEIFHNVPQLFQKIMMSENIQNYYKILQFTPHPYWETHYSFENSTTKHNIKMGENTANSIIINAFISIIFAYSCFMGNERMQEHAIDLLSLLPFEMNFITKKYKNWGFPAESALHSQAILELNNHYCSSKKCLDCLIGQTILSS